MGKHQTINLIAVLFVVSIIGAVVDKLLGVPWEETNAAVRIVHNVVHMFMGAVVLFFSIGHRLQSEAQRRGEQIR